MTYDEMRDRLGPRLEGKRVLPSWRDEVPTDSVVGVTVAVLLALVDRVENLERQLLP